MSLTKYMSAKESAVESMFDEGVGEDIAFTIQPEAMGHIMASLSTLYSDPIHGSVREVLSNAIDAVRKARAKGNDVPDVEIWTPSDLSPYLVISDSGSGMDYADLKEVYTSFGASTKRDSLDEIGFMGYGAKSPMAYTDNYEVITTKDGVTRKCLITNRNSVLNLNAQIIDDSDHVGTTVRIPVNPKDFIKFRNVVESFRRLSFSASLIVNGEPNDGSDSDYVQVDDIVIHRDSETGKETSARMWVDKTNVSPARLWRSDDLAEVNMVINGYLYNLESYRSGEPTVIIELSPGVVDFVPSRDTIMANKRFTTLYETISEGLRNHNVNAELFLERFGLDKMNLYSLTQEYFKRMKTTISDGKIYFENFSKVAKISDYENLEDFSLINEYADTGVITGMSVPDGIRNTYDMDSWDTLSSNNVRSETSLNELKYSLMEDCDNVLAGDSKSGNLLYAGLVLKKKSYTFNSSRNKIMIVEVTDKNDIKRMMTRRATLSNMSFDHVFFVKDLALISEEERNAFSNYLTSVTTDSEDNKTVHEPHIKYMTVSEAYEFSKPAKTDYSTAFGVIYEEGFEDSEIVNIPRVSHTRLYLEELRDEGALFVVTDGILEDILNGYIHAKGKNLLKRKIVVLESNEILKGHAELIFNGSNMIFGRYVSHKSAFVKNLIEQNNYYRSVEEDILNSYSDEQIISATLFNTRTNPVELGYSIQKIKDMGLKFPVLEEHSRMLDEYKETENRPNIVFGYEKAMRRLSTEGQKRLSFLNDVKTISDKRLPSGIVNILINSEQDDFINESLIQGAVQYINEALSDAVITD